jgi:peptidoglycan hydrolase-like protein with peptidoglycan-binding domain
VLLLVANGCAQEAGEPDVEPLSAEQIDAQRLWQRITEEAPYETYSFWPGEEGIQPGQAPHGPFHRILVNKALYDAIPIPDRTAPHGTIIVKENMDAGQEVTGYTVMAKVDGYSADSNDWFWARYNLDGSARAAGAVTSCIVCHEGVADNDYVIVHPLDEPLGDAR